ncbi:hypothetical protein WDU94_009519 [Cyamophila willieti]
MTKKHSKIPKAQKEKKPKTSSKPARDESPPKEKKSCDVPSNLQLKEKVDATCKNPDLTESLVEKRTHCDGNANEINAALDISQFSPDCLPSQRPKLKATFEPSLKSCRKIEFSPSSSVDEKTNKKVEFEPNVTEHLFDSHCDEDMTSSSSDDDVEDSCSQIGIIPFMPTKIPSVSLSPSLVSPNLTLLSKISMSQSPNVASIEEQLCSEGHSRNTSSKSEVTCDLSLANSSMYNEDEDEDEDCQEDDMDEVVTRALTFSSICSQSELTSPRLVSSFKSSDCNSTNSSWEYEVFDIDSADKSSCGYSADSFDDKRDYDMDIMIEPLSTSTPFKEIKDQLIKPDVINVERKIEKLEDCIEEKSDNICQMLGYIGSEVERCMMLTKRKESNTKKLSDTLDSFAQDLSKADDLNKSICSKIEMINSDLLSSWRSTGSNIDLMQKYEDFEIKLSSEECLTKDLKKELDLLKREFTTLENRVTDIEDQKEINEKIREIQEKKERLSRVRKTINVGIQDEEDSISHQETERLYNKLEEKLKYCMKIANTLEQLEGDLISFQNDLKSEVEKLKNLEIGKSAEFFEELIKHDLSVIQDPVALQQEFSRVLSEKYADAKQLYQMTIPSCEGSDSGISDSEHDCERDRKLSDLRQMQKDLDSVLSSNKKTLIAQKMDETEAELRKLKNLRRFVFHSTLLPQLESEQSLDTPHDDTREMLQIRLPLGIFAAVERREPKSSPVLPPLGPQSPLKRPAPSQVMTLKSPSPLSRETRTCGAS